MLSFEQDTIFWSPKNDSEWQTIHLEGYQGVRVELVHNASLRILQDSHLLPSITVRPVPKHPGPILLTYRSVSRPLAHFSFNVAYI